MEAQAKRVQRAEQSLAKIEARGGGAGQVAAAIITIVEEVGKLVVLIIVLSRVAALKNCA